MSLALLHSHGGGTAQSLLRAALGALNFILVYQGVVLRKIREDGDDIRADVSESLAEREYFFLLMRIENDHLARFEGGDDVGVTRKNLDHAIGSLQSQRHCLGRKCKAFGRGDLNQQTVIQISHSIR